MRDLLRGKVVVVTGASSGLGREAAIQFASRACDLVLAARDREGLEETARMCERVGGTALCVSTDVTREQAVYQLAEAALTRSGRIDVWVNNAATTVFSALAHGPFEDHRRVIETNLFGAMFGARAVVPIFRRQKAGVLINVGSILSKIGQPFVPSYVISKFGLRGLSEALRAELADEPGIHVCTIFPYALDETRAMPPLQSPEKVARAIVELAEHPRRERHVPRAAVLGLALHWMVPRTVERLWLHALSEWNFRAAAEPRAQDDDLREPELETGEVHAECRPWVSAPTFAAWTARELVKIEAQTARHWLQQWSLRVKVSLSG